MVDLCEAREILDEAVEIRRKLEKVLGKSLQDGFWDELVYDKEPHSGMSLLGEYSADMWSWEDFVGLVRERLGRREQRFVELFNELGRKKALSLIMAEMPKESSKGGRSPLRDQEYSSDLWGKLPSIRSTGVEAAFVAARSLYAGELANGHTSVRLFRTEVLEAAWPLTAEQPYEFLESPATALFPLQWFRRWGIPLVEHYAELSDYHRDGTGRTVDHRATIRLFQTNNGGGHITKRVRYAQEDLPIAEEGEDARYAVNTYGGGVSSPKVWALDGVDRNWVWPGSVLALLRKVVRDLIRSFRWTELGAALFVLSGRPPLMRPISLEIRGSRTNTAAAKAGKEQMVAAGHPVEGFVKHKDWPEIRLTVEPWMPPNRVAEVYRNARPYSTAGKAPSLKDSQEPGLRIYLFVKEQEWEGKSRPELFKMWNERAPEDQRYAKPHGFWQAYKRAAALVEGETYELFDVGF